MYFESFPVIQFDPFGNGQPVDMTNLLKRVSVRAKVKTNTALYDTYVVRSGETPESLAYKLYGDVNLHWVILLFNDIHDRYLEWPKTENAFLEFVKTKYGADQLNDVHHYEITQESGDSTIKIDVGPTNTDYPSATAVTNLEFEEAEENRRRNIKLLDPRYVDKFVSEFKKLIKETVI